MATKLYIGNLAWATNDKTLGDHFSQAGEVRSASVVLDRESGRSRGFGFVEMATEEGTQAALKLDGSNLDDRPIRVNEARPQEDRPRRSNDSYHGGGGRSGGYGNNSY